MNRARMLALGLLLSGGSTWASGLALRMAAVIGMGAIVMAIGVFFVALEYPDRG